MTKGPGNLMNAFKKWVSDYKIPSTDALAASLMSPDGLGTPAFLDILENQNNATSAGIKEQKKSVQFKS